MAKFVFYWEGETEPFTVTDGGSNDNPLSPPHEGLLMNVREIKDHKPGPPMPVVVLRNSFELYYEAREAEDDAFDSDVDVILAHMIVIAHQDPEKRKKL